MAGATAAREVFAAPDIDLRRRPDGGCVLASRMPLGEHEASMGEMFRRSAARAPDRVLVAERDAHGAWRTVTYADARRCADAIAQALLHRGLGPARPVMVLSGNSVDHLLLMLGCFTAGVPIVPVSAAYSLQSSDYAKLREVAAIVPPALVYVADAALFAGALEALRTPAEVVAGAGAREIGATPFSELLEATPGAEVERAFGGVRPSTVAKVLFTSGSTGGPKGVITTHRMLCSNRQALRQVWPFLDRTPPIVVDWLPWSHTFGGSNNTGVVLRHGGSLYIDEGRPMPGRIDATLRNVGEIRPTVYFNVPAGYAAMLPALEADDELARRFFSRLQALLYAGASLSTDVWERLRALSARVTGEVVPMTTAWGATETAPGATYAHFPLEHPGNIGVPLPGLEVKLAPVGAKLELRVKGPNVTPGYYGRPDLSERAFDEEGFYRTGDAGELVDPHDPNRGIRFAGRIAEDFKLSSGTWVSTGAIRVAALGATDGLLLDAVLTGHDRPFLGLLAWLNPAAARRVLPPSVDPGDPAAVARCPALVERLRRGLAEHNAAHPGSSQQIARVLLLTDPPSLDTGEITDKGYINQHAVLARRRDEVERLYAAGADEDVIEIPAGAPAVV